MKIVKEGSLKRIKPWLAKIFKCQRCGCQWVLEEGDSEPSFTSSCNESYYVSPCPTCGDRVYEPA